MLLPLADAYLMKAPWKFVFAWCLAAYLVLNLLFAFLFFVWPDGVQDSSGTFLEDFGDFYW